MKFEFLMYRRYLDKGKKGERTLAVNPFLVTAVDIGDKKDEALIYLSGAYGPLHVVGNAKLVKLALEAAISNTLRAICANRST